MDTFELMRNVFLLTLFIVFMTIPAMLAMKCIRGIAKSSRKTYSSFR